MIVSDDRCAHCQKERASGESFFWVHHGNPGLVPGYCVDCAVRIIRAAFRFVDLRLDRELRELVAAVQPVPVTPMTITAEQLDELEATARDYPIVFGVKTDVTLQLVAIARAALAWREARRCVGYDAPFQRGEAERKLAAALRGAP